jgi:small conductance mechanosensitive channel
MSEFLNDLLEAIISLIPLMGVIVIFVLILLLVDWVLKRNKHIGKSEGRFSYHIVMLSLTALGILLCLLTLPIDDETEKSLLTVFGLVLTGIITLGSTTFASNALAGLMLRIMNKFRPGDFLRVDEHFGRVTERGLFHTEMQTEDRDLMTFPNMFLVQQPITVIHATGTMISANVSLGYDVPVDRVEKLLVEAGVTAGLEEPFMRINELGDFSVSYRLTGFLKDIKTLLGTRSRLRWAMLNSLHGAGIEIASPSIMIQRPIGKDDKIVPARVSAAELIVPESGSSETRIFDKAEKAGKLEGLRQRHQEMKDQVKNLKESLNTATPEEKISIEEQITGLNKRINSLESAWDVIEERLKEES